MGKLVIGPEGFVDLRRNPPATTVTVQGYRPEPEKKELPVEVVPEPPREKREEILPAIQKNADGLILSVAESVKVSKWGGTQRPKLRRIESVAGPSCYAIVSKRQFDVLSRYQWHGTRSGHMYRIIKGATGKDTVIWLHRAACNCNRNDRFVGFVDGDERNLVRSNLRVVGSKEEAKAIRRQALGKVSNA